MEKIKWGGLLLAVVLMLGACSKQDLTRYDEDYDRLYFFYVGAETDTSKFDYSYVGRQQTSIWFSSYVQSLAGFGSYYLSDTVYSARNKDYITGTQYYINVAVGVAGNLESYDRPVKLTVEGSGSPYVIVPDSIVLPANEWLVFLPLAFVRPPDDDHTPKEIVMRLESNEYFKGKVVRDSTDLQQFRFTFGNILPPDLTDTETYKSVGYIGRGWERLMDILGDYDAAKIRAIVDANKNTGAGTALLENANPLLDNRFEEFDYFFILKFINSSAGNPGFPPEMLEAFRTCIDQTKKYITAQRDAGNPILGVDGEEIVFP